MQEAITYTIIALTIGYVIYQIAKLFVVKKNSFSCSTGGSGCSSCSFNTSENKCN